MNTSDLNDSLTYFSWYRPVFFAIVLYRQLTRQTLEDNIKNLESISGQMQVEICFILDDVKTLIRTPSSSFLPFLLLEYKSLKLV